MLAVYTFFFSVVFEARWGSAPQSESQFALIVFVGLLLHGLLAEIINRAPTLIVANPNLVRKVVFPLEVLPVVALLSAFAHLLVGLAIWFAFYAIARGAPPPATAPLVLIVLVPFALMLLGFGWVLASLGVYLRDLVHVTPMISALLLFASPVFYPVSVLREPFRTLVSASPLALPIEQARRVLLDGGLPDWTALGVYTLVAVLIAAAGLIWFAGTSKGFADVV
jgi:lipopolysaccharide transport system permease protein